MTDIEGHGSDPWSVDLLADLHAGVLDEATARELWPRAKADPRAREILDALDATTLTLTEAPPIPMPADVAARIDAAIDAEVNARGNTNVVSLSAARRKRNKRIGWASGIVAAAAAVVVVGLVALPGTNQPSGPAVAAPTVNFPTGPSKPSNNGPLALTSGNVNQAATSVLGAREYGPLDDPQRRTACLAANNISPKNDVAGIKPITLDGKPGILMLLTTGKAAQFRLLVVGQDCAQGNPSTMTNNVIGSGLIPPTH